MDFLIFYSRAIQRNTVSEGLQGDRALPAGGTRKSRPVVHFESSQVTGKSSL